MKYSLYSWNVNGLRAVLKKGAIQELLAQKNPDFLCLQETKAKKNQVEVDFPEYQEIWNSAERAGYSGTAIFAKNEQPIISQELNLATFLTNSSDPQTAKTSSQLHDDHFGTPLSEGRITTIETPQFFLVTV